MSRFSHKRKGDIIMITQNELYDLSFVISLIRSEITNPNNISVLNLILPLLENTSQLVENNSIRKALLHLTQLNAKWEFIKYENYYVKTLIFKDTAVQKELFLSLSELRALLQAQKFDQAFDLADTLHVLPEIIADNKGKIPNSYQKAFKKPYQKRWKKVHKPF